MQGLEVTGQSFRSRRQSQQPQQQQQQQSATRTPSAAGGSLLSALTAAPQDATPILQQLLAPKIPGGLPAFLAGIKYMTEDHNLKVGVREINDILNALGYKIGQEGAGALHSALLSGGAGAVVLPSTAAKVLGVAYSNPYSRDEDGGPVGGYNIENIAKLSGVHAVRHMESAITRSETRQHKHMLVLPINKLLELLKEKMEEHLPSGAGLLEAVRLFHHGHGTHISFVDFKTTIKQKFNLTIPEKRLRNLFSNFDCDGGGDISIDEFVSHVWEPEKNNTSPVMVRANQEKLRLKKTLAKAERMYEKASLAHMDARSAAKLISGKLQQHIHAGGNELLQAFREFHHGHGMEIDRSEFVTTLKELGIKLSAPAEYGTQELFLFDLCFLDDDSHPIFFYLDR